MPTLLLLPALLAPLTLAEVLDRGLFDPYGGLEPPTLRAELHRLCAAEEPIACLLIAAPLDDPAFEGWCLAGDVDACAVMAWRSRLLPVAIARSRQRVACEVGGGLACVVAAALGFASPEETVRIAEAACREGHTLGCLLRAGIEPDRRVRRAQFEAICQAGDRRGCLRGALLATGAARERLEAASCDLMPGCRPPGAPPQGPASSTAAANSPISE